MNKNKRGKPFIFPDSFILLFGYIQYSFHLPYRQTEGIIKANGKTLPEKSSSYGHICKRVNKLNVNINNDGVKNDDDEYTIIAADSTSIKVTNRGQWMEEKWNVLNRKGYLKIHIAVNIKTKEILALEVTDEKVHDGRMLKKLVNHHVLDDRGIMIESVLADGAHDTNTNFQFLEQKGITPGIKVRKNSIISIRNNSLRNREVRLQTKDDLLKWKAKRRIIIFTLISIKLYS